MINSGRKSNNFRIIAQVLFKLLKVWPRVKLLKEWIEMAFILVTHVRNACQRRWANYEI